MYKVYFDNKLILEIDIEGDVDKKIDEYINQIEDRNHLIISRLRDIEKFLEDIYPRRDKDTNEEYLNFLKSMNPDFIESLENFGKDFFKEKFESIMILNPTKTEVGWIYKKKNISDMDMLAVKNINSLKIDLINEIPLKSKIKIIEEK